MTRAAICDVRDVSDLMFAEARLGGNFFSYLVFPIIVFEGEMFSYDKQSGDIEQLERVILWPGAQYKPSLHYAQEISIIVTRQDSLERLLTEIEKDLVKLNQKLIKAGSAITERISQASLSPRL